MWAFLLLFLGAVLPAQHRSVRFERLSIDQGLSQSTVLKIVQDLDGYLWFATEDGLNKYDGYTFTVFKPRHNDDTSLSDNYIATLYVDRRNRLWIGTYNGGLNMYDRGGGKFLRFQSDPDNPNTLSGNSVLSIAEDPQGFLWIGCDNGLNRFDPASGRCVRFRNQPEERTRDLPERVMAVRPAGDGTLWIGTYGYGVYRFHPQAGVMERWFSGNKSESALSDDMVNDFLVDGDGTLWIATATGGLNRVEPRNGRVTVFRHRPNDRNSLASDTVRSLLRDRNGFLWIGTGNGLDRFQDREGVFLHYGFDPSDPQSLSNNDVTSLLQDRSGLIWIGTFGGGLNKLNSEDKFNYLGHVLSDPDSLANGTVFAILEKPIGTLWVGTYGGGLSRFDRQSGKAFHYRGGTGEKTVLSEDRIRALVGDEDGYIWVGTAFEGLNRLDPRTGQVRVFRSRANDPSPIGDDRIRTLLYEKGGVLWIGSIAGGLCRMETRSGRVERFRHYAAGFGGGENAYSVRCILRDRSGFLWFGTDNGLFCMDEEQRRFTYFGNRTDPPYGLRDLRVFCLLEDRSGYLWVGTGGGLCRFDRQRYEFRYYDESNGLPNNLINGILEDGRGNLWISTNHGLSCFDALTGLFRNYDVSDGLQSNEFNGGAYFKSSSGEMFFGGVSGLNYFFPDRIKKNTHAPPVVISRFSKSEKEVPEAAAQLNGGRLQLHYSENAFSFEFAALDFTRPEKNRYAYKLDGFDSEWIHVDRRRFASYTNLDGGDYVFRVKACNNDGIWNETGTFVRIHIVPPPWKTWWAYFLYVLALIALVFGFIRYRLRVGKRRLEQEWLEERYRKLQEIDQLKTEFMNIVSHELRAPLTSVVGFARLIQRKLEEVVFPRIELRDAKTERTIRQVGGNIDIIVSEGMRLTNLINDLLDIAKLEAGRVDWNMEPLSVTELLEEALRSTAPLFEQKELTCRIEIAEAMPLLHGDKSRLLQVLINLLSNAAKFTEKGGVVCRARVQDGMGLVCVQDSGRGIKPEDQMLIFQKFKQVKDTLPPGIKGTGLGLPICRQIVEHHGGRIWVESNWGVGSTFCFTVKLAEM